jgi:hypothetical protein
MVQETIQNPATGGNVSQKLPHSSSGRLLVMSVDRF